MATRFKKTGKYKMFRTTQGNRILRLRGDVKGWYAWIEGDLGTLLVLTDGNHERDCKERSGKYVYTDFEDDPTFQDQPHLFLKKESGRYDHLVLPEGLPRQDNFRCKAVYTDKDIRKKRIREHVAEGGITLPVDNYDNRNVDEVQDLVPDLSTDELAELREYEQAHKRRKTVLDAIDARL